MQTEQTKFMCGFLGGSVVKNPPANAGKVGSTPGPEDPLEKETATQSRILALENSTEPGVLKSTGWQRVRHH